jgi:hypothetical protein
MFDVWALAFLMVSLVVHFFIIFPFLCMWADTKPFVQEEQPRVSVRMSSSVRAPHRSDAPQKTGSSSSSAAHPRHRHPQTTMVKTTQPTSVHTVSHNPKNVSAPKLPSAPSIPTAHVPDEPESAYPTAQNDGKGRSDKGRGQSNSQQPSLPGPPGPNQPANGNPQGSQQGAPSNVPSGQGKFEGADLGAIPEIPLPEILQRRDMSESYVQLECSIDPMGNAKTKVTRSSGRDDLDQLIAHQLEATRWKPALKDGKAVATTVIVTIKTSLTAGQKTLTLQRM